MRELRAVALSEDGGYLVLADAAGRTDGEQFRVPVDDRLRAALRGVRRNEVRTESALTPREIQARLRAGETAAEVARAAGIPVERVERYEGPVLAERARVVQEARAALLPKDPGGVPGRPLGEVVDARLVVAQDNPAAAQWDAWRRVDGIWLVQLTSESRCARWTWDPVVRRVRPHDDAARALVAPESAEQPAPSQAPPPAPSPRTAGPALTLVSDQRQAAPARPAAAPPAPAAADSDPHGYPQPAAFPPAPVPVAHPGEQGQPQRPAATLRNPGIPVGRPDPRWAPAPHQQWDETGQPEVLGARPDAPATPAHAGSAAPRPAEPERVDGFPADLPAGATDGGAASAGIGATGIAAAGFRSPAGAPSAHPGAERVNIGYQQAPAGLEHAEFASDAAYADLPGEHYPPVEDSAAAYAGPPATASEPNDHAPEDGAGFDDGADTAATAGVDDVGVAPVRRPEPQPPRRTAASRVSSLPRNTGRRVALEPGRGGAAPAAPAAAGRGGAATRAVPAGTAAPAAAVARGSGRNEENPRAAVAQASPSGMTSATPSPGRVAGSTPTGTPDGPGRGGAAAPPARPTGRPAGAKSPAPAAKSAPPATSGTQRATPAGQTATPDTTTEVPSPAAADATRGRRPAPAAAETEGGLNSTQKEQPTTDGHDDVNAEQQGAAATSRGRQNNGTRGGERPAGGRRGRKSVPAWDDIVFGARRT